MGAHKIEDYLVQLLCFCLFYKAFIFFKVKKFPVGYFPQTNRIFYIAYNEKSTQERIVMNEILNIEGPVSAHRLGQREGFIAGIIVSTGAYYLFKAYKPTLTRWNKNPEKDAQE